MMSRFMIKFFRSSKCLEKNPNLKLKENIRFSELFHEQIISEMNLSKDKQNIWVIMSLPTLEEVKEIVKTIPLHFNKEAEIDELI